jgi:hypothetical protein
VVCVSFSPTRGGADLDPNRIKARAISNLSFGLDLAKRSVPISTARGPARIKFH